MVAITEILCVYCAVRAEYVYLRLYLVVNMWVATEVVLGDQPRKNAGVSNVMGNFSFRHYFFPTNCCEKFRSYVEFIHLEFI
jgi:hypothetical protein